LIAGLKAEVFEHFADNVDLRVTLLCYFGGRKTGKALRNLNFMFGDQISRLQCFTPTTSIVSEYSVPKVIKEG